MSHGSKYDALIWQVYLESDEDFLSESVALLADATKGVALDSGISGGYGLMIAKEGLERESETTVRINQQYFRSTLLKNYKGKCCMTGLDIPQLLVASHIKPWKVSDPKTERLAASNGLLLNAFHDRAFDKGLITIGCDNRVIVSKRVKHNESSDMWLYSFEGQEITLPAVMPPAKEFLEYHQDIIFLH